MVNASLSLIQSMKYKGGRVRYTIFNLKVNRSSISDATSSQADSDGRGQYCSKWPRATAPQLPSTQFQLTLYPGKSSTEGRILNCCCVALSCNYVMLPQRPRTNFPRGRCQGCVPTHFCFVPRMDWRDKLGVLIWIQSDDWLFAIGFLKVVWLVRWVTFGDVRFSWIGSDI